MKIALACDHTGYELKIEIKLILEKLGYEVHDFGIHEEGHCDISDYIYPAALEVGKGNREKGIFIDGLGSGSALIANKVYGVYASVCNDLFTASLDRTFTDSNVLCVGSKIIDFQIIENLLKIWLMPRSIENIEKYEYRNKKIREIEKNHLIQLR